MRKSSKNKGEQLRHNLFNSKTKTTKEMQIFSALETMVTIPVNV